jgi:glycosyltransferase involved in cell wall biosynthesis
MRVYYSRSLKSGTQTQLTLSPEASATYMGPFKDKRILIVSPEAWGPMKISKHHYASTLARAGARVFFLGPSVNAPASERTIVEGTQEITLVNDVWRWPGQRLLPRPIKAGLDAWYLSKLAKRHGGGFDLIWNFDPHRFQSLRERAHAHLRILHVMDLPRPADAYEAASNADLVIAVSPSMLDALDEHIAADRLHVPHGVTPAGSFMPKSTIRRPGVNLGYAGNLAMRYLDHNSLLTIAERHPNTTLHLFGATQGAFGRSNALSPTILEAYKRAPNVILHGSVDSEELHSYLEQMDLLLVAYDSAKYPDQTRNAHKVLEYLSTGRPVLASFMADLTDLRDLITMASPGMPISELVDNTIDQLHLLNAPSLAEQRKRFAALMSYSKHLEKIGNAFEHLR